MASKLSLLSELALHVLKRDGPLTTHQIYRACLAMDAPTAQTYKQPGHREYRIIDGRVIPGTTPPPNPDHLSRSVRHLKLTLRGQNALGRVGHSDIDQWIRSCDKGGSRVQDLLNEALVAKKIAEEEKDSNYVWIDSERYLSVLGENAFDVPTSSALSKAKRKPLKPNYALLNSRLGGSGSKLRQKR